MTLPQKTEINTAVTNNVQKPAHILIVDDEPEIAESLADYLTKKQGFQVSYVHDGQSAIDFLQETVDDADAEIDLVLLDMRMPNLSGLDVLNWIRQHPELSYTRVVLLTAAAGSHEKVEALTAGADDYITKPYRPLELLARVNTILRTQQLEKQLQRQSQQLAALNAIGQKMAVTLELSQVLETAVSGVDALIIGVELSAVLMVEKGSLRYKAVHGCEAAPDIVDLPKVSTTETVLGVAFSQQTAVFLNHTDTDENFNPEQDAPGNYKVTSVIVAPLVVRGRPVGVISAYNKTDDLFTEVDLDLFASLASSISGAIENVWLFQGIRLRQQELLENRNTLQALINGIPNPIYTINGDWQLVAINTTKADELETTPDELVNQVCYKVFFQRDVPCDHCLVANTLREKTAQSWTINWIGEDHLPREWNINGYPIPSQQASSARAVIVWQDRTEERRLENSLLQAGKLAAIGQLAAGVAHEINNPLTVINANAEMLKMVTPPEDDNYEAVDLIALAGDRAAKVVRGLLDFARQEQYAFVEGNLNLSIQQSLNLVQYQLRQANIQVIVNMEPHLPEIVASWEHLKSVWLNLIVNARDALQKSSNPQIEITSRLSEDEKVVLVLVRDTGKGMLAAELVHIFEPFYTTKDPGKGTGLGLATSHRIVEQHGGDIDVVSTRDQGTTFIVRLPIERNL